MKSRYITPVVTIFDEQGRIDPEQNTQIYDFIKNHVSGFVVMGSTGEFFSLNMENARQMIKTCSEFSRGDMKVGNDSNLLIVFYVQIMPDDFVMQLHRF
ncbi:putative lyase [Escherichia coli]|nr:dihydrodipicolinate synthase family protein [Escherichia coli]STJ05621.1 putative lyase [Escherichia coli]